MGLAREQPALLQDLERARSGVRVTGSEAWLRLPDGQEGRLVWSYIPLRGAGGELYGVLAQAAALAPLTDASVGAADDQLRLKAIMDHVADGIVTLDTGARRLIQPLGRVDLRLPTGRDRRSGDRRS